MLAKKNYTKNCKSHTYLVNNTSWWETKEEEKLIWTIKKALCTIDRDTESNKIHALLDEVESREEDDIDHLLSNLDAEFVLEKDLENDIVLDEQSNNVLVRKANIYLAEDAQSEVNDEENSVQLEQEIIGKDKDKRKGKIKGWW